MVDSMFFRNKVKEDEIDGLKGNVDTISTSPANGVNKIVSEIGLKVQDILSTEVNINTEAQHKADEILSKAAIEARKRLKAIIYEAGGKAEPDVQDMLSSTVEEEKPQHYVDREPEVEPEIVENTNIVSPEAEQNALQIIDEAKKRADEKISHLYAETPEKETIPDTVIEHDPDAPNLISELRHRYMQVTFGEPSLKQPSPQRTENTDSAVIDFPVLAGDRQEMIGRFSIRLHKGEVVNKTYEHMGRLLVIKGGLNDWEFQYLQQLTEKGKMQELYNHSSKIGVKGYVILDFPVLMWSHISGREDRYTSEVKFP